LRISHIAIRLHTAADDSGTWFPLPPIATGWRAKGGSARRTALHGRADQPSHSVTDGDDAPEIIATLPG